MKLSSPRTWPVRHKCAPPSAHVHVRPGVGIAYQAMFWRCPGCVSPCFHPLSCNALTLAHNVEEAVRHGLLAGQALLVVVPQQLVQEVQRLWGHQVLVLGADELGPRLACVVTDEGLKLRVQLDAILVQVLEKVVCSQDASNLYQLIIVVVATEEWILSENHACEHAAQAPQVQGVVVVHQIYKQFRPFVVAGGYTHIVFSGRVVELCKAPVNETQLSLLVVNHDVVRLDISVHHSL
mmetsp:Transcript_34396/g.76400  ORF Transcript_34396/g.76400 Transcript_34396/m.76400 type:complete len:237 (+) Transcript_34396:737-1447(+)